MLQEKRGRGEGEGEGEGERERERERGGREGEKGKQTLSHAHKTHSVSRSSLEIVKRVVK
jgi:hypothetical protein